MPLFTFKCESCGHLMEKFFHKVDEDTEVLCEECGSHECHRKFSDFGAKVCLDAKTLYNEKIAPDAKRIMDNMRKDKKDAFSDIYGDK
jgi:putative FmdB family regulatory protein